MVTMWNIETSPLRECPHLHAYSLLFNCRFSPTSFIVCLPSAFLFFFLLILVSDFYIRGLHLMSSDVCCLFIFKNKALQSWWTGLLFGWSLPTGQLHCTVTEQGSILFFWNMPRCQYLWVFSLGSVSFLKRRTVSCQEQGWRWWCNTRELGISIIWGVDLRLILLSSVQHLFPTFSCAWGPSSGACQVHFLHGFIFSTGAVGWRAAAWLNGTGAWT